MELSVTRVLLNERYIVEERLGKGSYAEIYLARDRYASPDSPYFHVVIKALNTKLQGDIDEDLERTLIENFENEAKILDLVRHPNIISRLGHGTAKDNNGRVFHYLILEYLPGGDLSKLCRPNGLPLNQVVYYLEQVCAGLMKAHEKGIIHRDIKPQNLLLTRDQKTVKITDFGVARFSELIAPVTKVGTNVYAPPEHSPLNPGELLNDKITPAADIYSLAKTAYVLLTGKIPREFINKPITSFPDQFKNDEVCQKFLKVLERATQDNPADRYQSIQELWSDIAITVGSSTKTTDDLILPSERISDGYTDLIPDSPDFKTFHDLNQTQSLPQNSLTYQTTTLPPQNNLNPEENKLFNFEESNSSTTRLRHRQFVKAFLLITLFAIALFATQIYLKNNFTITSIENFLKSKEGIATTDVNIRPAPRLKDAPIGLLPKGSKVKILRSQDGWYEVDVVEYSRPKRKQSDADRGWVNGKYIELKSAS